MNDNVYNVNNMPLSSDPEVRTAQEKILRDEEIKGKEDRKQENQVGRAVDGFAI